MARFLLRYRDTIFTSLYCCSAILLREGLPKVLLEAAVCGRVVITTNMPGCRDAQALATAIKQLINNKDLRLQMVRKGCDLAGLERTSILITGIKTAFASLNAKQRYRYSCLAKSDVYYVYTAEIDHVDKENNDYSHKADI